MTKITEPLESKVGISEEFADPANVEVSQETQPTEETTNELPDKYRNKSIEDVVKMHQEAEKVLGRQSTEVGELRKALDNLIKVKTDEITSPTDEKEPIDFIANPDEYTAEAISANPKIKEMEEFVQQTKQQQVLDRILQKHPEMPEILQDTEFGEWINQSTVRQALLKQADQQYDFAAADELLTLWKERKQYSAQTSSVVENDRKQQVKKASTGSSKGSSEPASRKIYRRSDIVNLMINDPERYKANVAEFDKAYREGRVK